MIEPPSGLAVVTGAARGIGAETAERLAATGHSLLLVDACSPQEGVRYPMPRPAELDAVAACCRRAGAPTVDVLLADVARPCFTNRLRAELDGRPVTVSVAVAGLIAGGEAWDTEEAAWATLVGVHLHGTRRLAEATVPAMREAGKGSFVGVASAAAVRAMPRLAAYAASKAAVVAYVRALAADLAGTGVRANVVCPGSTRGAMLAASADIYGLPDQQAFAAQHLLRRLLEPGEVAETIAWLAGAQASAITGAIVPVDAGLSA